MGRYSNVNVVFGTENGLASSLNPWLDQRSGKRVSEDMEEFIMRGTYEAFILVKVKDGRKFVCALNRRKRDKLDSDKLNAEEQIHYLENRVIWN